MNSKKILDIKNIIKDKNIFEFFYLIKNYEIEIIFLEENDSKYLKEICKNFKQIENINIINHTYIITEKKLKIKFKSFETVDNLKIQINNFKKSYNILYYNLKNLYDNYPKLVSFVNKTITKNTFFNLIEDLTLDIGEKTKDNLKENNIIGFVYNNKNKQFLIYITPDLYSELIKLFIKKTSKEQWYKKIMYQFENGNDIIKFSEFVFRCRICKKSHYNFLMEKIEKCIFKCIYCRSKNFKHNCVENDKNKVECLLCKDNGYKDFMHYYNDFTDCEYFINYNKNFIKKNRENVIKKQIFINYTEEDKKEETKIFELNNNEFPKLKKGLSEESLNSDDSEINNKMSYKDLLLTKKKIFNKEEYYKIKNMFSTSESSSSSEIEDDEINDYESTNFKNYSEDEKDDNIEFFDF